MSSKKHYYKITYNTVSTKKKEFTYDYANTKGIKLLISNNGVAIEYYSSGDNNSQEISENSVRLVSDAVKKAMLFYIIHYSKPLEIKQITVQIDDDIDTVDVTQSNNVFCMVDKKFLEKLPDQWLNSNSLKGILNYTKTSYDSRIASLFAFLNAKSKTFETERFFYLWMSFNGIYVYISKLFDQANNSKFQKKEYIQIMRLQKVFGLGSCTIGDDAEKSRISHEVAGIVKNISVKMNKTFFSTDEGVSLSQSIINVIKSNKNYDLTAYGYLLTQFSYYHRCNLFHANKPITLFAFKNESELQCLRVINVLLEDFIITTLPNLFDDTYINSVLIPKIKTLL